MSIRRPDENRINAIFAFLRIRDSMSRRLIGKVKVMSNKLRSFLIVVISIAVVMAALPMNALRVNADGEYTVIYHPCGDNKTETMTYNASTKAPSPNELGDYDVYGCKFVRWSDSSTGDVNSNSYTTTDDLPQQNIELYGVWEFDSDNYVKVTLDCDGTYGEAETLIMPTNGSAVIAVPASWNIPNNIVFSHWSVEGSNVEINDTDLYTFASDTTLKANWKQVYVITYNVNANSDSIPVKTYTDTYDVNATTNYVVEDNMFTYDGYKFVTWYSSSGGPTSGVKHDPQSEIDKDDIKTDFDLYAWWEREITLYENNGSTSEAIAHHNIPIGSELDLTAAYFVGPEGKTLVGWTTTRDDTTIKYVKGQKVKISGNNETDVDHVLYAQWGIPCTVHFEANYPEGATGTSGSMNDLVAGKGFTTPINNGYLYTEHTFKGWNTQPDGTGVQYDATSISLDDSYAEDEITLYAQWETNKYTITYMSENGSSTIATVQCDYGKKPDTPTPEPTKAPTETVVYTFDGWSTAKDSQGTALTSIPETTGNATYYAHFTPSTRYYTVSATANPTAGGTVSGSGSSYKWNDSVTLEASANYGYTFVKWTDNGADAGTATTYSIPIDGNHTVVAEFERNSYTVTLEASEGGQATIDKTTCLYEDQVTVAATADTGYTFVNWVQDGQVVSSDPTYTFTVTKDTTVKPVFSINSYTISLSSDGNGSVEGAGDYNYSSTATVTASPNTGYYFVNWTDEDGDEVSTSATYSFTVSGARSLKANFALKSYTIGVTAGDNGSVTGKGIYYYGESITVKAKPETGYHFVNWTIDGNVVSTNANYTFTVSGPADLKANFAINSYTVKFVNDDGTLLKEAQFVYGSTAFYHVNETPKKKPTVQYTYTFAGWDKKLGTVTEDITYTAVYDATVNKYKITFKNEDGTVLQTGEVEYGKLPVYEKDTPTKAATVQETFTFAGWDKEISKVTGETVYTATYTSKPITKDSINYKYFTVAFVTNGGSEIVSQLVAEGGVAFKPEEPLRERYTFGGWYIDEALTKPFSFATAITSDITLYAKWIKGSPDIEATYAVVGLGSTAFELGSGEDITVAVERSKDNDSIATHFKGVLIDGVEVDYYNYELAEDNSSVIIRADAFEGLDAGAHTITIVYDDGTAEVELVVADANEPTAAVEKITETEAGDTEPVNVTAEKSSNWGLWIALGIVAVVVIAAIPIFIIKGRSLK